MILIKACIVGDPNSYVPAKKSNQCNGIKKHLIYLFGIICLGSMEYGLSMERHKEPSDFHI